MCNSNDSRFAASLLNSFHPYNEAQKKQISQVINSKKVAERDALRDAVQSMKKRITEIAALRKHIYNYSDTRATYEAYRKAGYSKKSSHVARE